MGAICVRGMKCHSSHSSQCTQSSTRGTVSSHLVVKCFLSSHVFIYLSWNWAPCHIYLHGIFLYTNACEKYVFHSQSSTQYHLVYNFLMFSSGRWYYHVSKSFTSYWSLPLSPLCVCVHMCAHTHAGTCRSQKRVPDALGLELQVIVSRLTWVSCNDWFPWVLGIEFCFS